MSGSDDQLLNDRKSQRFTSSGTPMVLELVVLVDQVDPDLEEDSVVVPDSEEDLDSVEELKLSELHQLLMESTKESFTNHVLFILDLSFNHLSYILFLLREKLVRLPLPLGANFIKYTFLYSLSVW